MCGDNWTSLIHTLEKTGFYLDEALLTYIFIIWKVWDQVLNFLS